jgi:hypothetical protein
MELFIRTIILIRIKLVPSFLVFFVSRDNRTCMVSSFGISYLFQCFFFVSVFVVHVDRLLVRPVLFLHFSFASLFPFLLSRLGNSS